MFRASYFAAALFGCIVLFLQPAVSQAQSAVTRGPYLQLITDDGVVIRWRTRSSEGSAVRYGTSFNNLYLSQIVQSSNSVFDHEVTRSGLSADTRYYYAVGSPSSVPSTGDATYTFKTAPIPGSVKATRLWVLGDSGTGSSQALAVRDRYKELAAASRDADLLLMLGDNAYNTGTDSEYQSAMFNIYPEVLRKTPIWPTLGNHDGYSADSTTQSGPYYDIFTLPRFAEAGGVQSGTEAYYSFDYGNIHFVCLNSYDVNRLSSGAMATWLESDLATNTNDWLIAFYHHPPYTKGSHDSDSERELKEMRQNIVGILEDYGVDLTLGGHSHSYERSLLLDGHYGDSKTLINSMKIDSDDGRENGDGAYVKSNGFLAPHDGGVYVVAGSSGTVISNRPLNHPAMKVSLGKLGSLVIDINGNRLDAIFLDDTGTTSDHFTILHGAETNPPVILSVPAAPSGLTIFYRNS